MSWRKIARPDALPRGTDAHRRDAAAKLADWYTGGQSRSDLGGRLDYLAGRADRGVSDLIADLGGVKKAAAATGAAERTVRDWRAGRHAPSAEHRGALERSARRATVSSLGGTKAVAQLSGRSESAVRTWVRRRTAAKGDAVHQLNRHEVRQRHLQARQQQGMDPAKPLYLKATGHARVRTTTPTPPYDADRGVRHEIDPDVQTKIEDALARDDTEAVQQAIEQTLTEDYANLGDGLYDGSDYGFFLDRVDDAEIDTT